MTTLPIEKIQEKLKEMPGWKIEGNVLKKEFEFPSFTDAMVFINEFAQAADDLGYYPYSVDVRSNKVIVSLISPDGYVSDKDLVLVEHAQKAEAMVFGT
jgi:4a-hydroxytetrahydrobiopterin dehydratase